jgi:hypothetical protein
MVDGLRGQSQKPQHLTVTLGVGTHGSQILEKARQEAKQRA